MEKEIQELIDRFFRAIELRQLEGCLELLTALLLQSQQNPPLQEWCYYLQGIMAFELQNDWAKAERIFSELLTKSIDTTLRFRLYYALARTLEVQGRWQEAIAVSEQALIIADELNRPLDKAKAWKQIAVCYRQGFVHGDYGRDALQSSVRYIRQALAVLDSVEQDTASSRWFEGSLWNTLGATYRYLEDWDQAATCYQHDLTICLQMDDQHGAGISYLNLGEVFQHRAPDNWPQALRYYTTALQLLQSHRNRYLEVDVLQNLASLYHCMGDMGQALDHYRQAVSVIEDLRTRVTATDVRTSFFTTMVKSYQQLVHLLIETKENAAAFDMTERARSRSFIELLGDKTIRPPQQVPGALLEKEQELRSELRRLYQMADDQRQQIATCEAELGELLREIRLFAADYTDLRVVQPLTHRQVQQRLPIGSALLSYFVTDSAIFAFVVKQDDLIVERLALTPVKLQYAFDEEGNLRRLRFGADGRLHDAWMLKQLYQHLIQPLVVHLEGVDALYLLPHATLHLVPFHALYYEKADGQMHTLLDDYEIVYAPSATVLLDYCQQKRPQPEGSLLAIGHNGDLSHAEAETVAIAKLVGGQPLVGIDATCETLFAQAENFRWLHFACHGSFNVQRPLMSHLRLADGALYASDVLQRLRLCADLVTLAACETGRNQVLKGDELIGLVRAFIYAGTSSIIVSLWPVDELSTRILMEHLYRELLAGKSNAAALRSAQHYVRHLTAAQVVEILVSFGINEAAAQVGLLLSLTHTPQIQNHKTIEQSAQPVFAHPYFWASFLLIGDQVLT